MSTELVISFEIDGLHFWPDAPKQYEEFSKPHRHLFKFICWWSTKDSTDPNRREKELWELRQETILLIHKHWATGYPEHWAGEPTYNGFDPVNFKGMSCEGIADKVKEFGGFSKVFCGEEYWLGAVVS
jgi:hypothetical protein